MLQRHPLRMLRIFHTADWHLGQKFHEFDREVEHEHFLQWLLQQLAERQPEVLLVAGDVYDSITPPASSVRQFHRFLAQAHQAVPGLQIIITAGNHDPAARLEAPQMLYQELGIHVIGTVQRDAEGSIDYPRMIFPLRDKTGAVAAAVLAIPYLRPADVPVVRGAADAYMDGIAELYQQATQAALAQPELQGLPLLALGHCHMLQGQESVDSERRIILGGATALPATAFPPELCYIALGHLHRYQHIQQGRIVYSGSPLPLSFTEKDYTHRLVELQLQADGQLQLQTHTIPVLQRLLRVPEREPAELQDVMQLLHALPPLTTEQETALPYLQVRVLQLEPLPNLRRDVEAAVQGKAVRLVQILPHRPASATELTPQLQDGSISVQDLAKMDPLALFQSAHEEEYGQAASAEVAAALQHILSALHQQEASA